MAAHAAAGALPSVIPMGMEKNKLWVTIIEAKDLIAADVGGTSDPYVVIKEDKSGLEGKGKTSIKKKTLTPNWNESFEFHFNTKLTRLCFKVYDHDMVGEDDLLGKAYVEISHLYDGHEKDLWLDLKMKVSGAIRSKGQLHVKLRAQFLIPVAYQGQWLPPVMVPHFCLGLGWDFSKKKSPIDLDASVLALDASNAVVDRIAFNHLVGLGGAVRHTGDNRTGQGKGDDEQIHFDLAKVPANVDKFCFVVNVFGGQPLSTVKSAYCRIVDSSKTLAFTRCTIPSEKPGLFFGYMVKFNGYWYFQAVLQPVAGRTAGDSLPEITTILSKIAPPK